MCDVPVDVWRTLARAALTAEGDSLAAWLRLSTVSRTWREALAGVDCSATIALNMCLAHNVSRVISAAQAVSRRAILHAGMGK